MPDLLTAEERAAIDAAVAAGKVRKIACGTSAFEVAYDPTSGHLRYAKTAANPSWRASSARGSRKVAARSGRVAGVGASRPVDPVVQEEATKIREMAEAGAHWGDVEARFPHLSEAQINYRLGLSGGRLAPRPRPHEERRRRIAELIETGAQITAAEICAREKISRVTLAKDLKAIGRCLPAQPKASSPRVEAVREKIKDMVAKGMPMSEMHKETGWATSTIKRHLAHLGIEAPRATRRAQRPAVAARHEKIRGLVELGLTVREIAERIQRDVKSTRRDIDNMGLKAAPAAKGKRGSGDTAAQEKAASQSRARAHLKATIVRDRRRFKTGPVAGGKYGRLVPADATETLFPNMRRQPGSEVVLKDGSHSQKIGGDVLVGHLKGAKIFTLTLEERATCPKTCSHWRGCYGNGMNRAPRFAHGPALQKAIREEVAAHCKRHGLVLIRLHVLGDFYSPGYVSMWSDLLAQHPNLTLFGFTAWRAGTKIGDAIASLRTIHPRRFMIRESGRTGSWGSFAITDPMPEKTIGDAIVCPEQRETNLGETTRHCGNCAVCWSTDAPVAFIKH